MKEKLLDLGRRVVADIERLQDFQIFTGYGYGRCSIEVKEGRIVESVTNVRTQTSVDEKGLARILVGQLDADLPRVTLYQLVAKFEAFFVDVLKLPCSTTLAPCPRGAS